MRKLLFLSFAAIVLLAAGCSVQPQNEARDLGLGNTGTASLTVNLQGAGAKSSITVSSNAVTGAEMTLVNGSSVYSTNWFQGEPSVFTFQGLSTGQYAFTVHDWDASGITNTSSVMFTLAAGYNYTINVMLGGSVSISVNNGSNSSAPSLPMPACRLIKYYNADGTLAASDLWTNFTGVTGYFGHFQYNQSGNINGYYADGSPLGGGHWVGDPGPDGNWLTADDALTTYQLYGTNEVVYYYSDNTISSYYHDTYDSAGNEIKRVCYVSPGPDGVWFTGDDQIPEPNVTNMFLGMYNDTLQPNAASYYIETFSADKIIPLHWSWSTLKIYDGAGPDHIWFTADDHVMLYARHEFNDPVSTYWFTKEYDYTNAGPDGIWGTADDVLYISATAVNHY